jgi:Ser/Thr protein kinase RdoA (MazF antagonist)
VGSACPADRSPEVAADVQPEAGRPGGQYPTGRTRKDELAIRVAADLALINAVLVEGFGWVRRRGRGWPLRAESPDYGPFLTSSLPADWPGPLGELLPGRVLAAVETMLDEERARPPAAARLAHGDFDATAIFCAAGRYTGVIDFGEIRGAEPAFDVGHFHLHDQEHVPSRLLPALLDGYARNGPPPDEAAVRRSAVLLGLRQLCRWLARGYRLDHPAVVRRAERIRTLSTA